LNQFFAWAAIYAQSSLHLRSLVPKRLDFEKEIDANVSNMPDAELNARIRKLKNQLETLQLGFSNKNPQIRFVQIEGAFHLHGVINDADKFNYTTVNFDTEVADGSRISLTTACVYMNFFASSPYM